MSKVARLRKKLNDLLGIMRTLKKDNNIEGVSIEDRSANIDKYYSMSIELSDVQKELFAEEQIEASERHKGLEKEYGFTRYSRGDLKFRATSWDDPISFDIYQPSVDEIKVRDNLIWQRYKEPSSLSSDQLVFSYRKFLGERLFLRHVSSGLKGAGYLSPKQLKFLSEFQKRAQATTVSAGTNADGGYLVPTETEAGIFYQMARTGPFAGPMGELGTWLNLSSGADRKINVNNNIDTLEASTKDEAADLDIKKAAWGQYDLSLHDYSFIMPYTVQLDQDSASDLEQELAFTMSQAFGRRLNKDAISGNGVDKISGLLGSAKITAAQTITSENDFDAASIRDANDAPITTDEVTSLKFKLDEYYRQDAAFVTSDYISNILENMVDSRRRFLFDKYNEDGKLLVRRMPVCVSTGFPTAAADTTAGIVGSFRNLIFGYTRGGLYLHVLKELYMQSLQLGLVGHMRVGGAIIFNGKAFSKFKFKA